MPRCFCQNASLSTLAACLVWVGGAAMMTTLTGCADQPNNAVLEGEGEPGTDPKRGGEIDLVDDIEAQGDAEAQDDVEQTPSASMSAGSEAGSGEAGSLGSPVLIEAGSN